MPFDPARDLPLILGSLAGMGRGSNAFTRRWMQLEQMAQQQRMQEQQLALANQRENRQADIQQQDLMLRSDAARRAEEQQRMGYTQNVQRLFLDPDVDPDIALQLATMGLPQGYDAGAIQSMHAKVFTPDERTRRKAAKRLAEIENDPQVKRHILANQDIGATTWEAPDLGSNPEDPQGRPIYTVAQLQRLAQKPTPAAPLPKIAAAGDVTAGSFEEFSTATPERQADILRARRVYTEAGREPDRPPQGSPQWVVTSDGRTVYRVPQAGDKPRDPVAERNAPGAPSPYAAERATRTLNSVDELMGQVSHKTVGVGSLIGGVIGTPARAFRAQLNTLKSNIAFNELTEMREASKTGGALGNVSNVELGLLESALGALDTGMDPESFKNQLRKVRENIERWHRMKTEVGTATPLQGPVDDWMDVGGGVRIRPKR